MANDRSDLDDRAPPKKSSALWIVLAVVGALLICSCVGCAVLIGLLLPAIQGVQGEAEKQQRMNDMKQVALAIHQYMDDKKKAPANVNDIVVFVIGSKTEARLRSGEIQVLWNVAPMLEQTDGTSNVIFAWENRPDPSTGQRLVAYMDGHVDWIPEQQFPTTPKAKVK